MNAPAHDESPPMDLDNGTGVLGRFCAAAADDLASLATLHDVEADAESLQRLREVDFPRAMGLVLTSESGRMASDLMVQALAALPQSLDASTLETLAADFADIYLTHGYRASPNESVWTDPEQLERQSSMFRVRQFYFRYGLAAADWRRRADDHLVSQLQFLSIVFAREPMREADLRTVVRFMDEHLLRWLQPFARRVASRCATQYFAAVVLLTESYCEELRERLTPLVGTPRPEPEPLAGLREVASGAPEDAPYVPGVGPSL